jgi:hypothetical protein
LEQAIDKTRAAVSYRMELTLRGTNLGAPGEGGEAQISGQQITLLAVQGQVRGEAQQWRAQGAWATTLGISSGESIEAIVTGGKTYVRGPVPALNATRPGWYELGGTAGLALPVTPKKFLDAFAASGIDASGFARVDEELNQGQKCAVYVGDKAAVTTAFSRAGGVSGLSVQDLGTLETTEFQFSVCADGYVHRLTMRVEGRSPADSERLGQLLLELRLSEIGAVAEIRAPEGAEPLAIP